MLTPKISIVTTCYNSGKTIKDTLESVLAQSYTNYELIIKDGGSKDDTIAICRTYEPKFEGRLRIISEPDKGIYDAMNIGIQATTGDIIGILNSDDFFTSTNILERVAQEMQNDQLDAVYGDVHYVAPNNLTKCVRYYSSKKFTPEKMRYGYMPAHPSFYCRRDLFDRFGYFDTQYRIAADFELLLRFIYPGKINTKYLATDFVTMRVGGISTSGLKSHLRVLKEHQHALKKHGIYSNSIMEGCRYLKKLGELKW